MKRIILVTIILLIFTSFMNLNGQWLKIYGGSSSDRASSIQQTNDGGYIVAGNTYSFGAGASDIWVLKLTSDGDIEWQRSYGGNSSYPPSSIQQTNDGGYIVASSTYPDNYFLILKLTADGDIEWQKTYGGSNSDKASSIQQTDDGGYIVAGNTYSFGAGVEDILILKLTSDGEIEWQKTYGGSDYDEASSIQQTNDGGYIVAGNTYSIGHVEDDILILKLTADGDIEWQKTYGGSDSDEASSIQQTNDGGYIVAGWTELFEEWNWKIWILKLSSGGEIEWQRSYGGSSSDWASSIQQTNDGGYIVAGKSYYHSGGEYDIWVLKLTSDGDIEWHKTYGSYYGRDWASSIQQTNDGGYIVAGDIQSGSGFYGDAWILKLLPYGNIDSMCRFIKASRVEVSNTNISPEDTYIESEDTDIAPQYIDISPQDTNAYVYDLCSEKPLLLIGGDETGYGSTDPAFGTYIYDLGTEVQIKAIPWSWGYFREWTGDVPSGHEYDNPITITMNSDKFIVAHFQTTPPPYRDKGEEEGGGAHCFITTAAYGSPLHPYVEILRDFRDKYLMPGKLGRKLVELYYKHSPYFADLIVKHKALKVVVRINLLPFVVFSYSMVNFGPIVTAIMLVLIFALPIFLISFFRKKLRRVEAKDPKALASRVE